MSDRLAREQAEAKFIEGLRDEAYKVRDCFTRYSIQAIGLVSVGLGSIAGLMIKQPQNGLLAGFAVIVIFPIVYLGIHKYGTSNRLLAYELHLQRIKYYSDNQPFKSYMARIGWEEAMRAYRIVQPTLFEAVYDASQTSRWRLFRAVKVRSSIADEVKKLKKANTIAGPWYAPGEQLEGNAIYRPGGYLEMMLAYLTLVLIFAMIMAAIGLVAWTGWGFWSLCWLPAALLVLPVFCHARFLRSRLQILENGMLSIHSTALVWEAVVLAHYRAMNSENRAADLAEGNVKSNGAPFEVDSHKGYTAALGRQAKAMCGHAPNIHQWLDTFPELAR